MQIFAVKQKRNKPFYRARCGRHYRPSEAAPGPQPAEPAIPYLAISYWNDRREGEETPPDGCYVVFLAANERE